MPTASPTATPTLAPTTSPATLLPTASPTPTKRPSPSPSPVVGLVITSPLDGSTVTSSPVVIEGLAPPNSPITHDIPLNFDEHTTADAQGNWSFTEPLNKGENTFKFRIDDDMDTEITLTVVYSPL